MSINTMTFVAPNLAGGEALGRECIRSDTQLTEQRSHRPNSAQPGGRPVFWAEAVQLVFSLCLCSAVVNPALAAENRVLELDGNGSYVELPPNIFQDLEEATVEGWVKWKWSRAIVAIAPRWTCLNRPLSQT